MKSLRQVWAAAQRTHARRANKQESERDRSLPRPVGETGRRSVGNRKERLRDYASSPGAEGDNYDSDTLR